MLRGGDGGELFFLEWMLVEDSPGVTALTNYRQRPEAQVWFTSCNGGWDVAFSVKGGIHDNILQEGTSGGAISVMSV